MGFKPQTTFGSSNFGQNTQSSLSPQPKSAFGISGFIFPSTNTGFQLGQQQQLQQQQQPQQQTIFFGFNRPQQQSSPFGGSSFGANKFGFGDNKPNFSTTTTATTSLSSFGSPQTQQQSKSLFGSQMPFGSSTTTTTTTTTTTGFGAQRTLGSTAFRGVQQNYFLVGTGNPRYVETKTENGIFTAITSMPEYRNKSFEELRLEDLLNGTTITITITTTTTTTTIRIFISPKYVK
jgi:nuclear pore complex protein Nup98-Nup96